MMRSRRAPIVAPTVIATFWLLLRPLVVLEGGGEAGGCVGGGMTALELVVVEGEVGAVMGVEAGEERGMWAVMAEDVVVLDLIADVLAFDVLLVGIVGKVVEGFEVSLDTVVSPPSCELVHNTGFCPLFNTMLKSLLMNVGGVVLEVRRSDSWKWHTQVFPSSRGTRAEPVAETDWLYARKSH